ncbi:unnamed protein product [Nippostrongylus brasiliensis]|uniref:Cytochrome P450 n=1 Tax=Nippostrongylus brasiliensis TaxID=27835 RepID=A0A0N4YMH9_NIPBR|nr:unnamed protein product [Nippostrongylus brasiliensis]
METWRTRPGTEKLQKGLSYYVNIINVKKIVNIKYYETTLQKHGPVFTVWLGPIPTVHIADYKLSHEAMVRYGANYQDRWGPATMLVGRGGRGLLMSNGELWLEQRRFALQVLRNLGANEEKFHVLKKRFDGMIENVSLADLFAKKWMTEFPLFNMKWKNVVNLLRELKTFVSGQIEERKKLRIQGTNENFRKRSIDNGSHSVDAEPCDYVDAFIKKMKEDERNGMDGSTFEFGDGNSIPCSQNTCSLQLINFFALPKNSLFSEETLTMNVIDMWIAGQETTSTTLLWAMIYMLKHPQDKPNTPYLTATIAVCFCTLFFLRFLSFSHLNAPEKGIVQEIQRHASIFNVNLNRLSATDTEIGGYPVPKNTIVTAQLSLILSDETLFSNAKVVIGNILLRYSIHSVGGSPPTGVANTFGIIKRPRPFKMTFSRLL